MNKNFDIKEIENAIDELDDMREKQISIFGESPHAIDVAIEVLEQMLEE